jgi:hypothetical protein
MVSFTTPTRGVGVFASNNAVDLVSAIAWPLVVLVAVILLRRQLGALLDTVGKRATKVSIFQFAVELATVPQLAPSWKVPGGDVRQLTRADVFDSATMTLFEELGTAGASDYIVVDLGRGMQWLSSRLYIFAVILQRMRGLRSVVVTATKGEETGVFIGEAEPDRVRWALAMAYPWLETAFARAYAQTAPGASAPGTRFVVSQEGALEPWAANNLVRAFLTEIQFPRIGPPSPADPAVGVAPGPPEWIELPRLQPGDPPVWERAAWLTVALLEQIVGSADLGRDSAFVDSPDVPPDERVKAIARRSGQFVALVGVSDRFLGLADRRALVESIAISLAEQD